MLSKTLILYQTPGPPEAKAASKLVAFPLPTDDTQPWDIGEGEELKSVQTAPEPLQHVPESSQTAPEPKKTPPEPLQHVPESSQTLPEPLQHEPETLQTAPEPLQHVPETTQTAPEPLQHVPAQTALEPLQHVPAQTPPEPLQHVPETTQTPPEPLQQAPAPANREVLASDTHFTTSEARFTKTVFLIRLVTVGERASLLQESGDAADYVTKKEQLLLRQNLKAGKKRGGGTNRGRGKGRGRGRGCGRATKACGNGKGHGKDKKRSAAEHDMDVAVEKGCGESTEPKKRPKKIKKKISKRRRLLARSSRTLQRASENEDWEPDGDDEAPEVPPEPAEVPKPKGRPSAAKPKAKAKAKSRPSPKGKAKAKAKATAKAAAKGKAKAKAVAKATAKAKAKGKPAPKASSGKKASAKAKGKSKKPDAEDTTTIAPLLTIAEAIWWYFNAGSMEDVKRLLVDFGVKFQDFEATNQTKNQMKASLQDTTACRLTPYWGRSAAGVLAKASKREVIYYSCKKAPTCCTWGFKMGVTFKAAEMLATYIDQLIKDEYIVEDGFEDRPEVSEMKNALKELVLEALSDVNE